MKPKTVLQVTDQTLPIVVKYNNKEYLIKSTASGSLHMGKCDQNNKEEHKQCEDS